MSKFIKNFNVGDKEVEDFISALKNQLADFLGINAKGLSNNFIARWSGYKDEQEFKFAVRKQIIKKFTTDLKKGKNKCQK